VPRPFLINKDRCLSLCMWYRVSHLLKLKCAANTVTDPRGNLTHACVRVCVHVYTAGCF